MTRLIELGGSDIFTHMLVVGPTRSGKTATILKPMIYQLMLAKKRGVELGLSVVEPKGDVAQMVADLAHEMDIPHVHIDPMQPDKTGKFNPMEGEINTVAEATVIVLKGLFGKQEAFFETVQEVSARSITRLLKELEGDNLDIIDVIDTLRDERLLQQRVAELKDLGGNSELVHFFESELLGAQKDRYRQFVIGLRAQLENIVSNDALRNIMTDRSSLDLDEHFEKGGVLAVNTALGMLRSSGDAFGQFVIMHLQNATFRRPGTEDTRVPHFLIIDEYSRYINPDVEIFLSLAAEYRVAGILATQSLGQLAIESGKLSGAEMKRAILASCRNRIVFGGVTYEDAKDFADEFGEDRILMRQSTYKNRIFLPNLFPDSFRDTEITEHRFDPTDIRDGLPRFTYIHQLMQGGVLQKPAIAKGTFVPRNWKELREWEKYDSSKSSILDRIKRILSFRSSEQEEKVSVADLDDEQLKEIEEETVQEENRLKEMEKGVEQDNERMKEKFAQLNVENPKQTPEQQQPEEIIKIDEVHADEIDKKDETEEKSINHVSQSIDNDKEEFTENHKGGDEEQKGKIIHSNVDGFWD